MEKQDNLGKFMKELPREAPSVNFTQMVMERVSVGVEKSPVAFQPLISRQGWRKIALLTILVGIGLVIFRNYFPGSEGTSLLPSAFSLDPSVLLKPFASFVQLLGRISPAVLFGLISISTLVMVDKLISVYARR